jgi:SAM-dependent methyltransferase
MRAVRQEMTSMLKKGTKVINKKGLNYVIGTDGKPLRFKPWLGDSFSFLYDFIMRKSIFPKKFGGDMDEHHDILREELKGVHGKHVLELATGSGSAVNFLMNDNRYTGTDVSPGLLKRAVNRFLAAGFKEAEFHVASADDLPFEDESFDVCTCILSLNFFDDLEKVLKEVNRVLARVYHPRGHPDLLKAHHLNSKARLVWLCRPSSCYPPESNMYDLTL